MPIEIQYYLSCSHCGLAYETKADNTADVLDDAEDAGWKIESHDYDTQGCDLCLKCLNQVSKDE